MPPQNQVSFFFPTVHHDAPPPPLPLSPGTPASSPHPVVTREGHCFFVGGRCNAPALRAPVRSLLNAQWQCNGLFRSDFDDLDDLVDLASVYGFAAHFSIPAAGCQRTATRRCSIWNHAIPADLDDFPLALDAGSRRRTPLCRAGAHEPRGLRRRNSAPTSAARGVDRDRYGPGTRGRRGEG